MKALLNPYTFICFSLSVIFSMYASKTQAQALSFTINPSTACYSALSSNTLVAQITGSPSNAASFSWTVTGPLSCTPSYTLAASNGSIINITYPCCGNYSILATALDATLGIISTLSSTFAIACPPVISILGNTLICAGNSTTLNASGASTYTWSNSVFASFNTISPTVTTTYTVTGTLGICSTTAVQTVSVNPLPSLSIIGSTIVCLGSVASLTASGATTYTWTNGPSTSNYTFTPLVTSLYTVTGNSLGCLGTALYIVTVPSPPSVSVFPSTTATICPGTSLTVTAAGALSYSWNTGATGSVIVQSPTVTTTYTVIGTNGVGCTDVASVTVHVVPPIVANFTYSYGANGLVNFTNTSYSITSNTTFTWSFGNSNSSFSLSPSTTHTSNGLYSVTLTASSGCTITTSVQTITITSVNPCAASFTLSNLAGNYTFTSTSIGTSSSTVYYWNFGNGNTYSATGSPGIFPPMQSYNNGSDTIRLIIVTSNPNCTSMATVAINVCLLIPDFTKAQTSSVTVNFLSTSSNTLSTTLYAWDYGDGALGSGLTTSHTYSATGIYSVVLLVTNDTTCKLAAAKNITITNCVLLPNYTHTTLANGVVQFNSNSSTTMALTNYRWNFGDGIYALTSNPTHTYVSAGNYYVTLSLRDGVNAYCVDSLTQSINVTGVSCIANSKFIIQQSGIPGMWFATPSYPYNVIAATWYWGDGTQSNGLYSSHTYDASKTYNICLSVTVSCGASSTYCLPYELFKLHGNTLDPVTITIVPPSLSTGIPISTTQPLSFSIYPNPNNGEFTINLLSTTTYPVLLNVYNLMGEFVYGSPLETENALSTLHLENLPKGIYFIKLSADSKVSIQKIIITD